MIKRYSIAHRMSSSPIKNNRPRAFTLNLALFHIIMELLQFARLGGTGGGIKGYLK